MEKGWKVYGGEANCAQGFLNKKQLMGNNEW